MDGIRTPEGGVKPHQAVEGFADPNAIPRSSRRGHRLEASSAAFDVRISPTRGGPCGRMATFTWDDSKPSLSIAV